MLWDAKLNDDRLREHHKDYSLLGRKTMNALPQLASPVSENYLTAAAPIDTFCRRCPLQKEIARSIAANRSHLGVDPPQVAAILSVITTTAPSA